MLKNLQTETPNLLLRKMAGEDFLLLKPWLSRVNLALGDQVAYSGQPIDHIYFPEGGIAAILDDTSEKGRLAVGLIGFEGLIGLPALVEPARSSHDVLIRACGTTAYRLEADRLHEALRQSSALRALLLRFATIFTLQVARTLVSNLIHPIERRMARWILLYHDRLEGDAIDLTHEEIGIMLGIRRASATDVLHMLEGEHAIRNTRGRVTVRDRSCLERLAGESYGAPEAEYRRLIAPFGKASERVG